MPLSDLIVTNKEISENLIEKVLKDRVELVQDGNKVVLTREGSTYPNKIKVLLFLSGGKAWELLDHVSLSFTPVEMEKTVGIPGNSLRPILKEISDNYMVNNDRGKYQITAKGIYELEKLLENITKIDTRGKKSKPKKIRVLGGPTKTMAIDELLKEGYFSTPRDNGEIISELGRRGVTIKQTSLPSFILPLLRKKVLTRDYKLKDKRKVWAYKANEVKQHIYAK
jgi:hypothetical protein